MIFTADLAKLVSEGRKTATRRQRSDNERSPWWRDRCRYRVGQRFAVQPGRGKTRICEAVVTSVYCEALAKMSERDAGREGFPTLEAFRTRWEAINGDFDGDEVVHVVEFKLA